MFRINPAFDRFPNEAQLVGKLLAGFGEIEFSLCRNAANAMSNEDDVIKALYRLRATSSRIYAADALARPWYCLAGFQSEYEITQTMVRTCLRLRNQFAHCNWADQLGMPEAGLFFTDLQADADTDERIEHTWRHVDIPLLTAHETYFATTMEWLWFLHIGLSVKRGKTGNPDWPRPPELEPPLFHNPPALHIPPWLNEDQKARHVARTQAAQGGAPTPTKKQRALEASRAEKRAKKAADRARAAADQKP